MDDEFFHYLTSLEEDEMAAGAPSSDDIAPSRTPSTVSPELLEKARQQYPRLDEADLLRLLGLIRLLG